jgi:hypothetical protein
MIRSRFGLLIALTVVAMFGVAAGTGLFMAYSPLGDPSTATTEQVFRWLVTRDLAKEPAAVQQAIVHRLESGLGQSSDLSADVAELDESRRTALWSNIGVLLGPWLLERVDQYAKLPPAEQSACVDRFLDSVDQWSKIGEACLQGRGGEAGKADGSLSKLIADRIAECSRHAGPAEQKRISGFMAAVQARWIWRKVSNMRLFGKP